MNRNTENHFGNNPSKSMPRSAFKMDHSLTTSFNAADIIPIYWKECLPGDSMKMKVSEVIRMSTPIHPVMDNAYIDTYFFKIPMRLVDEHWEEFMGENKKDAWTQEEEFVVPQVTAPAETGWTKGSLASYFGVRINTPNISLDAKWFRAYVLCYNEWFRNQNTIEPAELSLGQETTTGSNGTDYVVDMQKGGCLAKAGKFADYFTRSLPEPSKGPEIFIPIGSTAPVVTADENHKSENDLEWVVKDTTTLGAGGSLNWTGTENGFTGVKQQAVDWIQSNLVPGNLITDLTQAEGATINALRMAFSIQRLYELDATGGTRYIEQIRAHFKVNVPDARLQRPEYVGGKRVNINMMDVIQTSSTDNTSPLGHEAGESKTIDNEQYIETAFTEHSILLGVACIRTDHSYQQRLERAFNRKTRLDYYWPELANLGNQGILNKEIFVQGTSEDDDVFGYQEAWAEYRYEENIITGEMNSDYSAALDSFHYGDDYEQLPTLSAEWSMETKNNIARTLAVENQDQFIASFYFDSTWYRPMPIYSIPSLSGWS